jgi:hypothetical protein
MLALALMAILSCRVQGSRSPGADECTTRRASPESRLARRSSLVLLVEAEPGISNEIVSGALDEATTIWRAAGVMIEWRLSNGPSIERDPLTVRVLLEEGRGRVSGRDLPLGWINFDASGRSEGIVHLSHPNVVQLLDATEAFRNRPTSYKELLAARALGRALAHELGHHLTASKLHSQTGLMKGRRLVDELFSPARTGFSLNNKERERVAKTLTGSTPLADHASENPLQPCEEGPAYRRTP